jgi:transposase-like protein
MEVIFSSAPLPALPPESFGINVNFCKNPHCLNFGIPADVVKHRHKKGVLSVTPGTAYGLVSSHNRLALKCLLCKEIFAVKSNLAVAEELARFTAYLTPVPAICCTNPDCANKAVSVEVEGAYQRFGQTAAGTPRYRCRLCRKTMCGTPRALNKQRITHQNKMILLALTNKMPIRRIAKVAGISADTLYGKINFIHRQCLAFSASRERGLKDLDLSRLYISVDRQVYLVNWGEEADRRNISISAVGSADNDTGYIFGMHHNFDSSVDPDQAKADAALSGDAALPHGHRAFARLWLPEDYDAGLPSSEAEKDRKAAKKAKGPVGKSVVDAVADLYDATSIRDDVEVSALKSENEKLPDRHGMQVHEEYCLYGHFQFLKQLLPTTGKLRFFLDQDSGIRAACFAAFAKEIQDRKVDAFFVKTAKELTIDQKRSLVSKANSAFNAVQKSQPLVLSEYRVKIDMMKAEIAKSVKIGQWQDSWCSHPLPNMSEPSKAMCWLTNLEGYDEDHRARLFLRVSLAGIDNFFQRVRRSINPLERPIQTASRYGRTWHGYSPYNPAMVGKLLDIYRTMVNFVEVGKDGQTPAMRIGLAKGRVTPEDILYFTNT